jgi:hypothetical protein
LSLATLGARGAALALLLYLASASMAQTPAWAGSPYTFACTLTPNARCAGAERHTYDRQTAVASRADAYIGSWLVNPSNGNVINLAYGWGVAGSDYRLNDDLWLDAAIGNYSPYNIVISAAFHY